ncbi:MAG: pyridoxine 5'-phosphate synthase, partial [Kiloniellales bacterium]|nr:pyridoxine 5'-phosphate synthase [Kiloniellales bacterium]
MHTKLSINLNKVALLRNQRQMEYPCVLEAARAIIDAGADGITVHPRPDERHIKRQDTRQLSQLLRSEYNGSVEFNIEGYPSEDWIELVCETRPDQATLVPDPPDARTSDHGWDLDANADFLKTVISRIKNAGIRVSVFVDCEPCAVRKAKELGADRVELYTGPYGFAYGSAREEEELRKCREAGAAAKESGIGLNAGHDLNLHNLAKLRNGLPWLEEVSIGHAFTADALKWGYGAAVRAYLDELDPAET